MPDNHVRVQRSGGRYYLVDTYGTRILEYTRSPSRALAVSRFKTTGTLQSESLRIHKSRIESGLSYIKGTTSVLTLTNTTDADDKFTISVGTDGATTIATNDDTGRGADLTLDADGEIEINADEGIISFKDDSAVLAKITTNGLDFTDNTGAKITFEGDTDNDHQTILAVTDPTADRTITFPDSTGTVALTSDITTSLSFDGSTANGVCTYKDADEISVESTLTYGSETLTVGEDDGGDATIQRRRRGSGTAGALVVEGGSATSGQLNTGGGSLVLQAGRPTGNAAFGNIDFQIGQAGTSGTALSSNSRVGRISSTGSLTTEFYLYEAGGGGTDNFKMQVAQHGATTLSTTDGAATAADLTLDADGDITLDAATGNIYVKDDGGNYTPGSDYEIATKKYVDDNAGGSDGWHGSTSRIKILHSDFIGDDGGRPIMIDDTGAASENFFLETFGAFFAYATVAIPTGYKATHVMIYGDGARAVEVWEHQIDSKTGVSKGTGNVDTEINITDVTSSTTNYLFIQIAQQSGDELHGGYVTITAV